MAQLKASGAEKSDAGVIPFRLHPAGEAISASGPAFPAGPARAMSPVASRIDPAAAAGAQRLRGGLVGDPQAWGSSRAPSVVGGGPHCGPAMSAHAWKTRGGVCRPRRRSPPGAVAVCLQVGSPSGGLPGCSAQGRHCAGSPGAERKWQGFPDCRADQGNQTTLVAESWHPAFHDK